MTTLQRSGSPDTASRDTASRAETSSALRYWPLDRYAWRDAAITWAAMVTALSLLGLLIVHVLEDGRFGRIDRNVSEWFADQRTPLREDFGQITSAMSDSLAVVPMCALLLALFVWRWRRWHDAILVIGALLFEKAVFLPVTLIAGRDRPPVGQLDGNPPSSSFFSGHVAAAVAFYFGVFVVVCWHVRSPLLRTIAAVAASLAVVAVASSRLLLGMHYISDVVVGALVGMLALALVHTAIVGTERRRGRPGPSCIDG